MTKPKRLTIWAIIGCVVLTGSIGLRVLAGSGGYAQPTNPGEKLDLITYAFRRSGNSATGLGVYLGTYAIGMAHCQILKKVNDDTFHCYDQVGGQQYSGKESSSGYGLLFMEYPGNCLSGYCLMNSRISLLLPIGDRQAGTMHWARYTLNGADGETGHTYYESDSYPAPLTTIEIRQVLADLDSVSGLSEPD